MALVLGSICCPRNQASGSGGSALGGLNVPEVQLSVTLPVTYRSQEGYHNCWAACAEMVFDYLGAGRLRQCEQAGVGISDPDCCTDGLLDAGSQCDYQWHPEFQTWGFDVNIAPSPSHALNHLRWEEVKAEINAGRPFMFCWVESSQLNHLLVCVGYDESKPGESALIYYDPLAQNTQEAIMTRRKDYEGTSGYYLSQFSFYRIRPRSLK